MPITQTSVQRFSVTSSKSFESVLTKLEAMIGYPGVIAVVRNVAAAKDYAELGPVIKEASVARLDRRSAR